MTKQKRHEPAEIILLLREFDSGNLSQESFCQQKQISVATLYRWRKKFGMMAAATCTTLALSKTVIFLLLNGFQRVEYRVCED
jgi:hypothetical protein